MDIFFLFSELSLLLLVVYNILKKVQISIIYLPLIIFVTDTINTVLHPSIWYAIIVVYILLYIINNYSFPIYNIAAILLIVYFTLLLFLSSDLTRSFNYYARSVIWFVCIPLIISIFKKFDRDIILKEVNFVSLGILVFYCLNVLLSTLTGYHVIEMYASSWWIKFGNMFATNFNILPVALFGFLYTTRISNKQILTIVSILFFFMILIPFRRSVIMALAVILVCYLFFNLYNKKYKFTLIYSIIITVSITILLIFTNAFQIINERIEKRNLQDRGFVSTEESRFLEYQAVLADMFIFKDYSPIFGYGFFDSWGNYGRGLFGTKRSLHGDLPSIAHSGGLLAVILYLLMIYLAVRYVYINSNDKDKYFIIVYFLATFIIFTITGRFTETGYKMLLFIVLFLPLATFENNEDNE